MSTTGVRVHMRGRGRRDFLYPTGRSDHDYGMVVPRSVLDDALLRHAVEAGAEFRAGVQVQRCFHLNGRAAGVEATVGGEPARFRARVVLAADGAASRLARQAGLIATPRSEYGIAVRAYLDGIVGAEPLLEIHLPLTDVTDNYVLPSYGWVFPTGPDSANVGVGLFEREHQDVGELYERFVSRLAESDPRFADARQRGALFGAPMRFDFAPERSAAPGLLLLGDAAGLISPFTGEGISYALESGKIAGEAIDRCLRMDPTMSSLEDDYRMLLEHNFAGYFELGRHSSRRYRLIWHVLESRFQSERPIFELCRRLVLLPEGTGDPLESEVFEDVGPLIPERQLGVREDLFAIGSLLSASIRKDWPVLTRVHAADRSVATVALRPALLLLLAARRGAPDRAALVELGAALELGYLSFVALSGVEEDSDPPSGAIPPANWGNKFAILVGDFLLAKAYTLAPSATPNARREMSVAIGRASTARLRERARAFGLDQGETEHLRDLEDRVGSLFALPCSLGARLSEPESAVDGRPNVLASFGRNLGLAYALVEDVLAMENPEERKGSALATDVLSGIYSLPVVRALAAGGEAANALRAVLDARPASFAPIAAEVRRAGVLDSVRRTAARYAERARACLHELPAHPTRAAFELLTDYALTRRVETPRTLDDLLDELER